MTILNELKCVLNKENLGKYKLEYYSSHNTLLPSNIND